MLRILRIPSSKVFRVLSNSVPLGNKNFDLETDESGPEKKSKKKRKIKIARKSPETAEDFLKKLKKSSKLEKQKTSETAKDILRELKGSSKLESQKKNQEKIAAIEEKNHEQVCEEAISIRLEQKIEKSDINSVKKIELASDGENLEIKRLQILKNQPLKVEIKGPPADISMFIPNLKPIYKLQKERLIESDDE